MKRKIRALAKAIGTDAINFNFGSDGERGYSEVTPSGPGCSGYLEILLAGVEVP